MFHTEPTARRERRSPAPSQRTTARRNSRRMLDSVSRALKDATTNEDGSSDLAAVRRIAKENKLSINEQGSPNVGTLRMNLGNQLRGKLRRGESVVILGERLK